MKVRKLRKIQARNSEYSSRWPPTAEQLSRLRKQANEQPRRLQFHDVLREDPIYSVVDELVETGAWFRDGVTREMKLLGPLV